MSSKVKKIVLSLMIFLFIIIGGGYYYISYDPNVSISKSKDYIFIPKGTSFLEVRDILSNKLEHLNTFVLWSKIKKYDKNIKSGRYEIKNKWSNKELVYQLKSGKQTPINLIFNNQYRIEDLAGRVAQQLETDSISILNAIYDKKFLNEFGFNRETVKSIFIPNTYNIYWTVSPEKFVRRMYKEYKRFWNRKDRTQKAKEIGLTPLQVTILASIVHKETSKKVEKKRVAGLYMNRLKKQMKLESCPTVIYMLKEEYNIEKKISRVLKKDLKIKSKYNTYINYGLPPAPICVPDIDIIDAVLNYEKHNYLYMCANPDKFGYNSFATNLKEHNKNRRRYISWLKKKNIRR